MYIYAVEFNESFQEFIQRLEDPKQEKYSTFNYCPDTHFYLL